VQTIWRPWQRIAPVVVPLATVVLCLRLCAVPVVKVAAAPPEEDQPREQTGGVRKLFDGRSLAGWEVLTKFDYSRSGRVYVADGWIVMEAGKPGTGIRYTGPFPKCDYEVMLQAKRIAGEDFFCAITFPVGKQALTLVVGGWGGSVVGLSSINGEPAVENETCRYIDFQLNRVYRIRLRVTAARIDAWIDDDHVVSLPTEHRQFSILWEVDPCLPFGIATWRTTGAVRNISLRELAAGDNNSACGQQTGSEKSSP